jgi:hypothetical protein
MLMALGNLAMARSNEKISVPVAGMPVPDIMIPLVLLDPAGTFRPLIDVSENQTVLCAAVIPERIRMQTSCRPAPATANLRTGTATEPIKTYVFEGRRDEAKRLSCENPSLKDPATIPRVRTDLLVDA